MAPGSDGHINGSKAGGAGETPHVQQRHEVLHLLDLLARGNLRTMPPRAALRDRAPPWGRMIGAVTERARALENFPGLAPASSAGFSAMSAADNPCASCAPPPPAAAQPPRAPLRRETRARGARAAGGAGGGVGRSPREADASAFGQVGAVVRRQAQACADAVAGVGPMPARGGGPSTRPGRGGWSSRIHPKSTAAQTSGADTCAQCRNPRARRQCALAGLTAGRRGGGRGAHFPIWSICASEMATPYANTWCAPPRRSRARHGARRGRRRGGRRATERDRGRRAGRGRAAQQQQQQRSNG
jgi:hypothetical protein